MPKIFIVNIGSESKKYALYEGGARLFFAHFEKEAEKFIVSFDNKKKDNKEVSPAEFENAIEYAISEILYRQLISDTKEIAAAGFRVVAPGNYFQKNKIINDEYLEKLKAAKERAPLHIIPVLSEIEALIKILPGVPIAGISDSAFHSAMPDKARYYGAAKNAAEKFDIFRFGYHGISFASVIEKLGGIFGGELPGKIIVCHLGGGSSVAAIKNGKSVDTSMGFTPLEGLVMANRVGDIDAGAVICLAKKLGFGFDEMENYLNTECGLLGLSGKSNDVRELIELEKNGDKDAALALDVMVYKIKKYIGAYYAALNGADALIFSGTIGERSSIIRFRVCKEMEALGIIIDESKNNETISADGFINKTDSPAKIVVVATDEMSQIAKQTILLAT